MTSSPDNNQQHCNDLYASALRAYRVQLEQRKTKLDQVFAGRENEPGSTPLEQPIRVQNERAGAAEAWTAYEAALQDYERSGLSGSGVRLATDADRRGLSPSPLPIVFFTGTDYRIDYDGGMTVRIYKKTGTNWTRVTMITGDPHVYESRDGSWDWHFGRDSTFILRDGTKIFLRTAKYGRQTGVYVVVGMDIQAAAEHGFAGKGPGDTSKRTPGVTTGRKEWDDSHADSFGTGSSGVFLLKPDDTWAVKSGDKFYDVASEAWQHYLRDPDVDLNMAEQYTPTAEQAKAVGSYQPTAPAEAALHRAFNNLIGYAITNLGELSRYLQSLTEEIARVDYELRLLNDPHNSVAWLAQKRSLALCKLGSEQERIDAIESEYGPWIGLGWGGTTLGWGVGIRFGVGSTDLASTTFLGTGVGIR